MMLILLPVLLAGFLFLCVRMQAKRYPEGNRDFLSKIALRIHTVLDVVRRRFTAGMWEAYKVLFLEYGIVMMAVIFLASRSLSFAVWSPIPEDKRTYYMYVQDMQGPIDASTDEYLKKARESAENSGSSFELLRALDMVEERVTELREKGSREYFRPFVLYDQNFNAFYGETPKNRQRLNAMIAMLFTVFLTAGICSYEKQSGVVPMLRSLKHGRTKLLLRKVLIALILSLFAWACVYLREFWQYRTQFGEGTFAAALRNYEAFSDFPLNLTIGGYLALLYGLRLFGLFMTAFLTLFLSSYLPNVRMAYLFCTAVLILPALFTVLGIGIFRWISPLVPVSAAELLLQMGAGKKGAMIPFILLGIAGSGTLVLYFRRWVKTRDMM